ncbi:MFS transporter [Paenibacillus gallinarum]|uniref:MFS transporter n=1 Tax=Paenibacillus gallinarum TaxID=2762232 RepID=A0ABR8T518_9BACL|nr:MFS transporter [Paenibacillus gallinarum]MBD7970836.1 MFS transporter [Paenibacillus gallinarum]
MNKNKKKIHFAWWILVGVSIMVGLTRGGLNSSGGLFLTPVTQDLGIRKGDLSIYFSIASIVTMIFLPIAGKMMAKYNIRGLLMVAAVLQAGSFAMFGFMSSVWGWYLFSIPMAVGAVFLTQMAGPVLINNWFKKNKGLMIGIMMAVSGGLGAVLQPIVGTLIANEGWRNAYIIIGAAVIIIVIPVVFFTLRMSPKEKGLQPYGADEVTEEDESKTPVLEKGVTLGVAKKSSALYTLIAFFFFITAIGCFAQHVPTFAEEQLGYDGIFASNAMAGWMVGALLGALAFGFLSDKIGARNTAIFAMVLGLVPVTILLTSADNSVMFSIAMVIFGFVVAAIGTLGPLLTSALFGNKEYSQIYAIVALGLAVAGIIALPGYGYIYDATGSYTPVLIGIACMMVINIVLIILAFNGKKKLEKAGAFN